MRIASLIVLLIVTNTTYSGFSGTGSSGSGSSESESLENQATVVDVRLPLITSGVDARELEASLLQSAGELAGSYKKLIDAGCSTLETNSAIDLSHAEHITTALPVDLNIPVTGSYLRPVSLRLHIVLDVCRRDGEPVTYVARTPLETLQNELVPIEFTEPKPLVKEFASVPYIPLPSLSTPVHEDPMTIVLHQVVCIFFSAALLLATIRDYQLTSALLQKHQNQPIKKIAPPVS